MMSTFEPNQKQREAIQLEMDVKRTFKANFLNPLSDVQHEPSS